MKLPAFLILLTLACLPLRAEYARVDIRVHASGAKGTLHLYFFDDRRAGLRVIDQGGIENQKYRNLEAAMKAHKCLAGCNGGFFGKDGNPLGLVIAGGKQSGAVNLQSSLTSGVLGQGVGQPFIERAASYFGQGRKNHENVLQSGPLLVEKGKLVGGLSNRRYSRRTFVLTDGANRWAIGHSPAITLKHLGEALADPKTFSGFNVATALNLDGGSSSGLWISKEHRPFYLREFNSVRNFVGVVRK